jgi:uncharacterized protein (TIGR03437 family)
MRILRSVIAFSAACWLPASAAVPAVQGVVNAASYQPAIASATWTEISGTNLSTVTDIWSSGDFTSGNLPTELDGVRVSIDGKAAYVYFISPGQINVLAPDDPTTGSVAVQVTNAQGTSNSFNVQKQAAAPGLFAYSQMSGLYAVIQAAATYSLVAPPGLFGPAASSYTAAPGENLILYATGLGPVSPAQPTGQLVETPAPTANPVTVSVGGQPATVQFAGIIGPGLYQINLTVPAIPTGNAAIVVSVGNQQFTQQVSVPIQAYVSPSSPTLPQLSGCLSGRVDYITYSTGPLSYGEADSASIGGTALCSTCAVKPALYPEFATRMERALERGENIQACYDSRGVIYQLKLTHP